MQQKVFASQFQTKSNQLHEVEIKPRDGKHNYIWGTATWYANDSAADKGLENVQNTENFFTELAWQQVFQLKCK